MAALHLAFDGGGGAADLAGDPDPELVRVIVPAIALIDVAAFDLDAGHALDVGDRGAEGVAVVRIAGQRPGVEHELAAFGLGHGVATLTLQPNSWGARALPLPMHSTSGACRE
jgi:hypothetical protein